MDTQKSFKERRSYGRLLSIKMCRTYLCYILYGFEYFHSELAQSVVFVTFLVCKKI